MIQPVLLLQREKLSPRLNGCDAKRIV